MNKKVFGNVGLITIIAMIAIGGYVLFLEKSPATSTEIIDQATGDKIYSNKRYGYTIQYPSNWHIDTTNSEENFTERGPAEDNTFIGGDTVFSNYPNPYQYDFDNPAPADFQTFGYMIYKVDPSISYDQFFSSRNFGAGEKEEMTINGLNAVKLTSVSKDYHPTGVTVVITLIKINDKMFVFNYSGKPIPETLKISAEKIITSFKPTN